MTQRGHLRAQAQYLSESFHLIRQSVRHQASGLYMRGSCGTTGTTQWLSGSSLGTAAWALHFVGHCMLGTALLGTAFWLHEL